MKLKLSCADYTFPLLPHDNVLDLIVMLQFQAVDIGLFGGRSHLRPENVLGDIANSARELVSKTVDRGLEIATVFLIPRDADSLSLATNNPDVKQRQKARDLFLRSLEFTAQCQAAHMSAGAGIHWDEESLEHSLKRDAEEMTWRVEKARDMGITFAIEPHANSLANTPAATLRLVEMAPGLTLALDYAHFTRQGIPDSEVEPLLEFTSHLHVRGANRDRLQAAFRDNTIDFARVLSVLNTLDYQGYMTLEYVWTEWERCNEVDNLSETVLFRDHLKNIKLQEAKRPAAPI